MRRKKRLDASQKPLSQGNDGDARDAAKRRRGETGNAGGTAKRSTAWMGCVYRSRLVLRCFEACVKFSLNVALTAYCN